MIKITKTGIIKDTKQENYSSPRFKDMVKFFATEWLGEAFTDCYLGVADQLWQQHDAKNKLAPQELAEYKNKVKQKTNDWLLEEYSIGIVVQKLFIPLLLIIDEFNKKGSITHKDLNKVFRKYEERYLNKLKPTDEPVRFKVNPEWTIYHEVEESYHWLKNKIYENNSEEFDNLITEQDISGKFKLTMEGWIGLFAHAMVLFKYKFNDGNEFEEITGGGYGQDFWINLILHLENIFEQNKTMALTPIELKQFLTPWLKEHDYINYYGTYLEQIVLPRWYKKLEQTLYKIGYGEDNQWMFVGEKSGCGTEIIKPQWQYSQLGKLWETLPHPLYPFSPIPEWPLPGWVYPLTPYEPTFITTTHPCKGCQYYGKMLHIMPEAHPCRHCSRNPNKFWPGNESGYEINDADGFLHPTASFCDGKICLNENGDALMDWNTLKQNILNNEKYSPEMNKGWMERIDLFIKTIKPEKTNKNKNPLRIISDGEPKWSYAHNYPIKFGDSTKILNTAIFDGEKTQNNIVGIIEYRDNKLDDEQKVLQLQTNMKVCSQCKFGGIIYDGGKNKYYEIHSEGNGLGFTQSNAAEMVINDWLKNVITEKWMSNIKSQHVKITIDGVQKD